MLPTMHCQVRVLVLGHVLLVLVMLVLLLFSIEERRALPWLCHGSLL
jgi:hypothetical protein